MDWHYDEIYTLIHELQPQTLIGNNHHIGVIPGEDFQMFERDLPGQNTTGWGTNASDLGTLPFETCKTINGSWGFNLQDRAHKSTKELIQYLIKSASYNSNLLLNVGPMPNGKIQPDHVTSLKLIGNWLDSHGETIYGTTSGPLKQGDTIISTRKANTIYLHLLETQNGRFEFPEFKGEISSMTYYGTAENPTYTLKNEQLIIEIPKEKTDDISLILELKLK